LFTHNSFLKSSCASFVSRPLFSDASFCSRNGAPGRPSDFPPSPLPLPKSCAGLPGFAVSRGFTVSPSLTTLPSWPVWFCCPLTFFLGQMTVPWAVPSSNQSFFRPGFAFLPFALLPSGFLFQPSHSPQISSFFRRFFIMFCRCHFCNPVPRGILRTFTRTCFFPFSLRFFFALRCASTRLLHLFPDSEVHAVNVFPHTPGNFPCVFFGAFRTLDVRLHHRLAISSAAQPTPNFPGGFFSLLTSAPLLHPMWRAGNLLIGSSSSSQVNPSPSLPFLGSGQPFLIPPPFL